MNLKSQTCALRYHFRLCSDYLLPELYPPPPVEGVIAKIEESDSHIDWFYQVCLFIYVIVVVSLRMMLYGYHA